MASRLKPSPKPPSAINIYTSDLPDPDLIIRTSGEFRLSNFLIWQGAYSEIYTTETYWPAFDRAGVFTRHCRNMAIDDGASGGRNEQIEAEYRLAKADDK